MSSRSKFSEYIRAFLISGLAALGFVILITLFAQVRAYFIVKSQDTPEVNVNSSVVKYLIEKNNYLAMQHPKDYKINVKLGLLYEYCKEFKESEHQYRLAIDKSDFNDYGPYQYLALLYIKMDRLEDAADLIDNIDARMAMMDKALETVEYGKFTKRVFSLENRALYKPKMYEK